MFVSHKGLLYRIGVLVETVCQLCSELTGSLLRLDPATLSCIIYFYMSALCRSKERWSASLSQVTWGACCTLTDGAGSPAWQVLAWAVSTRLVLEVMFSWRPTFSFLIGVIHTCLAGLWWGLFKVPRAYSLVCHFCSQSYYSGDKESHEISIQKALVMFVGVLFHMMPCPVWSKNKVGDK